MIFKTRIILIAFGIIIFCLLAPLAVFFGQGFRYDFKTHRVVKTGALVIKTDPKDATIFWDGEKLKSTTPLKKRFILPGEYAVEIKKVGYRPWKKRIAIHEQMVTPLPVSGPDKIALFLENSQPIIISTSTLDILATEGPIVYLEGGGIYQVDENGLNKKLLMQDIKTTFAEPKFLGKLLDPTGKEVFLIADLGKTWYLSEEALFQIPTDFQSVQFGKDTKRLLGINAQKQLLEFFSNQEPRLLKENILNFIFDDRLYYISANSEFSKPQLWQISTDGQEIGLLDNLPPFTTSQIITTPAKQIFLLLDTDLYEVGETLKKINSQVTYAAWNKDLSGLIYGNAHETWVYRPLEQRGTELLTRSSQNLGKALYNHRLGYIFYQEQNQIKGLELDPFGQPNVYTFAQTQNPDTKFVVNLEGTNLIYLDGEQMTVLKIR